MRIDFAALRPDQYQAKVVITLGGLFRLLVRATAALNVIVMRQDQFLIYKDWQPGSTPPAYELYRRGSTVNEFVTLAAGTYVVVIEGFGVPSFGFVDFSENYSGLVGPQGPSGWAAP